MSVRSGFFSTITSVKTPMSNYGSQRNFKKVGLSVTGGDVFTRYRGKSKNVANPNDIFESKPNKRNDRQLTLDNLEELNRYQTKQPEK